MPDGAAGPTREAIVEKATAMVKRILGVSASPRGFQLDMWCACLVDEIDFALQVNTGAGKGLVFALLPELAKSLGITSVRVIVIAPLVSVAETAAKHLRTCGCEAPCLLFNSQPSSDELTQIRAGDYEAIVATPEVIGKQGMLKSILLANEKQGIRPVIILDELHVLLEHGSAELRANDDDLIWGTQLAPFRSSCTYIFTDIAACRHLTRSIGVMSATLTQAHIDEATASLGLGCRDRGLKVFASPCIRPDLRYEHLYLGSASNEETARIVSQEILRRNDRVIVFVNMAIMSLIHLPPSAEYAHPSRPQERVSRQIECCHYYSAMEPGEKQARLKEWFDKERDGRVVLRVLLATSALGAGVDVKGVREVIIAPVPKFPTTLAQMSGRAGRGGGGGRVLLVHRSSDACDSAIKTALRSQRDESEELESMCFHRLLASFFIGTSDDSLEVIDDCCDLCHPPTPQLKSKERPSPLDLIRDEKAFRRFLAEQRLRLENAREKLRRN